MTNPRRRFWQPRGSRTRAAVVAALLAALILLPVALIAQSVTADRQDAQTWADGQSMIYSVLGTGRHSGAQLLPFELYVGDRLTWSSEALQPFSINILRLRAPGPTAYAPAVESFAFRFPSLAAGAYSAATQRLSGLPVTVLAGAILARNVPSGSFDLNGLPGDTVIRMFVFLTPFATQAAVRRVDIGLLVGVPLLIGLVALCAGFAVGRSMRSVDRLRRQTIAATAPGSTTVVVSDTDDELSAMAGAINDNVRRLRDALAAQQQFVADAAHELRNPLSVLISGLEIADLYPDEARWPEVSAQALRSARRLQDLTQDLLMLAQLDARVPERAEPVPLRELCAELVAARTGPGGPAVVLLDGPDPAVLGDPGRLTRVVGNLIDNAVRHAGTAVSIRLGVEGGLAIVDVHNDGPAISAPDRERIFDRFARLDEARARDAGGTGLGLAIAREAAARHGGTITVLPLQVGATFRITLPLHQLVLAA
jgi:signal transduction histidine kinase